jgi:hypothetical protein
MKPPYFELTSRCQNDRCATDRFYTRRKRVQYVSTSGELKSTTNQVCPTCRCWGQVEAIREVLA